MAYEMTIKLTESAMEHDPDSTVGYRLLYTYAERYLQFTQRILVTACGSESAFAGLTKALNQVAIWSRHYLEHPLPSDV